MLLETPSEKAIPEKHPDTAVLEMPSDTEEVLDTIYPRHWLRQTPPGCLQRRSSREARTVVLETLPKRAIPEKPPDTVFLEMPPDTQEVLDTIVPETLVKTNSPWMPTEKVVSKTPLEKAITEKPPNTVVPETPPDRVEI